MFAVIFTAMSAERDRAYSDTANKMRELAFSKYGCIDFVSAFVGEREVTISYWPEIKNILAWKKDAQHTEAQNMGREKWYSAYKVEVVEIKRAYTFGTFNDRNKD